MKNYDPNIYRGIHTVQITIQQWDYVGHIIRKVYGNCHGMDVLFFDFECDAEDVENDCLLGYNEEDGSFSATLKNESGDTLEIREQAEDLNKMIVKMEILDYVEEIEE